MQILCQDVSVKQEKSKVTRLKAVFLMTVFKSCNREALLS